MVHEGQDRRANVEKESGWKRFLYAAKRARAPGTNDKPISPSTRRKQLTALGTLFKTAVRWSRAQPGI
jgi:hypothetical protein